MKNFFISLLVLSALSVLFGLLSPSVMGAVSFTSTPGDISFCVNTWGFADLVWYVESDTNISGDYWIYRNGSLWADGDWFNLSDIDHEVWQSTLGVWNYTVVVNDLNGNVSDTVIVTSEMCCCWTGGEGLVWTSLFFMVAVSVSLLVLSIWRDDCILYLVDGVSWVLCFYVSTGLESTLTDFSALPLFFIVMALYSFLIGLQVLASFGWRRDEP